MTLGTLNAYVKGSFHSQTIVSAYQEEQLNQVLRVMTTIRQLVTILGMPSANV
jgi:hypothetical protein